MTNPFDRSFYKFLLGFICILAVSFVVLYAANSYAGSANSAAPLNK